MVLQKRLDYGFPGYQAPFIPRSARSSRRRRPSAKEVKDNLMCAFDLLATVAGKLLLETENSNIISNTSTGQDKCTTTIVENTAKKEHSYKEKPLKIEPYDQGSGDRKLLVSGLVSQACNPIYGSKESQHSQNDAHSEITYVLTNSEFSERHCAGKMKIDGSIGEMIGCKVEVGSFAYMDTGGCKLDSEINILTKDGPDDMPIAIRADMCSLDSPVSGDGKPAAGDSSDSSSKGPLYNGHVPFHSYNPSRDDVNVVSRDDDDENSSGCTHRSNTMGCTYTHPSPKTRFFRPSSRIGDRRIRKLLASRYWKVSPKPKNENLQNTVFSNEGMKPVYRNRNNCYNRQRSQRNYPFKKRKVYYHSSVLNSNGGISHNDISSVLVKGINEDTSGSDLKMHAATGPTSSLAGQQLSFQSRDSHVKLRIQSFTVPELFIEIPETETVGSLKRTVMEAVNAILGGGLHVGMLLQGKKVKDDHKTLQQTGISRDKHLEALGFTLEPTLSQVSPCLGVKDPPFLLPSGTPQPLNRYPPGTDTSSKLHGDNVGSFDESDHDSAPYLIDPSIDKNATDSKALVALPTMSVEALAMVPSHHKYKRSEIVQRRIRRPYSVTEVEALVQAVEKLGTGRWRDVKLRAFDNAKHRTYVDLKDKWKTLVHTARISPQQRRGEAVPQEVLDRVLAAHAHWSQQHKLKQKKQQQEDM